MLLLAAAPAKYTTYGTYAGAGASAGAAAAPAKYTSYGTYPSKYTTYGKYRRVGEWVKSLFS